MAQLNVNVDLNLDTAAAVIDTSNKIKIATLSIKSHLPKNKIAQTLERRLNIIDQSIQSLQNHQNKYLTKVAISNVIQIVQLIENFIFELRAFPQSVYKKCEKYQKKSNQNYEKLKNLDELLIKALDYLLTPLQVEQIKLLEVEYQEFQRVEA